MASSSVTLPLVKAVLSGSPADLAGLTVGDTLLSINGEVPRDIIRYQLLVDESEVVLEVDRGGLSRTITVEKADGGQLGVEVQSAVFDQVRTCDNHCAFCFIYQLPPGMRKSLSLKDDDFRLSFLYGNFTTLTRFTEADLERVITEGLSPLYVSIHATDPELRSEMLRNRRGGTSLRWLRALLDHGIEVHGQVVVCPGINDGAALETTLVGVLDEYPELTSLAIVPLGISDHSNEPEMRVHTVDEAVAVVELVEHWQQTFADVLGHRLVFAADEYYLLAERSFPAAESYEGFPMHEDGIGMARTFELELHGLLDEGTSARPGFFASVDGAPAEGYRTPRLPNGASPGTVTLRPSRTAPVGILTGPLGARVLQPLLDEWIPTAGELPDIRLIEVDNQFFGGNIGVTGLMVGSDVSRVLAKQPVGHRYLLPDVCLSNGVFLDGVSVADLPRSVDIIAADGASLRSALLSSQRTASAATVIQATSIPTTSIPTTATQATISEATVSETS